VADTTHARDLAGEANDPESQDLMIGRTTLHQKTVWMLESFQSKCLLEDLSQAA
jgi:starvation-inducible DNA-binding protein